MEKDEGEGNGGCRLCPLRDAFRRGRGQHGINRAANLSISLLVSFCLLTRTVIGDVPLAELAGALYPVQEALERAAAIGQLLRAADRNLAHAQVTQISAENRFDTACKAIMQLAKPALQANGYGTLTSRLGHHMTMIRTLARTIGPDRQRIITLDALRKQRNVADYSGDAVPESAVEQCIASARELRDEVRAWLKRHRPALLNDQGRGG